MYDKIFALGEITKSAVFNEGLMQEAAVLFAERNQMDDVEFSNKLFDYSGHLAAIVATMATELFLTEEQMKDMLSAIDELESLGQDS